MSDGTSILELRTSVKRWEREFESKQGRKPTSSDAKADEAVWSLYQKYRAEKKGTSHESNKQPSKSSAKPKHRHPPADNGKKDAPSTPQKKQQAPNPLSAEGDGDSETEEDEEDQTPQTTKVTEVFPTPQFRGKVLGLFDVELNLMQTPQKPKPSGTTDNTNTTNNHSPSLASSSPCPHTPSGTSELVETPQSKRTPEYFQHRVNLFPSNGPLFPPTDVSSTVAESPLIKRKASRTKPVSEIIREASEITTGGSRSSSILVEEGDSSSSEDEELDQRDPPPLNISSEPNILDTVPVMDDTSGKGRRKNPKRQTRRVVMRPIDRDGEVSKAKPTDNFVRLKINNKNKKFRRR